MTEKLNYWHDKDTKPYIEGEDPFYEEVIAEIADKIAEK